MCGRLIAAATTGPQWGLSWTYDAFGNRLSQNVTKGTAQVVSLSISAATNRITAAGFAYDAAGHMTQWPGGTVTLGADYDVEGWLSVVKQDRVAWYQYAYDVRGRRVRRKDVWGNPPKYEVYGPGSSVLPANEIEKDISEQEKAKRSVQNSVFVREKCLR